MPIEAPTWDSTDEIQPAWDDTQPDAPTWDATAELNPDEFGLGQEVRAVGRAVQRGGLQGVQALDTMRLASETARPPRDSDSRRAFLAGRLIEQEQALYGGRPERIAQLEQAGASTPVQIARQISGRQQRIDALPPSPDLANLRTDFWRTLATNPVETIATVVAESLPQAAPGMVGAALGGGPLAVGANSFGVEYANTLLDAAGPDVLRDPEALARWFAVPANQAAAKAKAVKRGLPVAAFDAATAGLAGRFLKPALGQGMRPVAVASAKELGTQMAGGMAGETAGQLASEGRVTSVPDIVLEGIAELGGAPAEVLGNLRGERRGGRPSPADTQTLPILSPVDPAVDELPDFREPELNSEGAKARTFQTVLPTDVGLPADASPVRALRSALPAANLDAGLTEAVDAEGFTVIDQAAAFGRRTVRPLDPFATDQGVGENVPAEGIDVVGMGRRVVATPAPVAPAPRRAALNPFALEAGKEPGKGNFRTPVDQFLAAGERERVEGRKATAKASQEFDRLLIQYGPELGWVDNLDALAPQMETAKQDGTTIAARVARSKELNKLRYRAAAAFGLDAQNTNLDVRKRAELLPRLQEYVQQEVIPRRQAESLTAAIQPAEGKQPVNTSDLSVGDVLNIDGEPVRVDAVDPDTGEVTLQDGTKFGRTVVADGQTLYVENVEPVEASTAFAPEETNSEGAKARSGEQSAIGNPQSAIFTAPESVADQTARMAREEAQANTKADREKLDERQAKPITGSVGDIGQGDLLGGGDLFSAPAPKARKQELAEARAARASQEAWLKTQAEDPVQLAEEAQQRRANETAKANRQRVEAEWTTGYGFEKKYPVTEAEAGRIANELWSEISARGGNPADYTAMHDDWIAGQAKGARQRSRLWFAAGVLANQIEQSQTGSRQLASDTNAARVQVLDLIQRLRAPSSADTAIAKLESLKVDTSGKVFDAIQGIPVLVWNGALSAAQLAIRAGQRVAQAIDAALAHIRARHRGAFDEAAVRAELERDLLGPLRLDTATPLPDFQPYAVAQRIFTQPFGAETLPWIGRLFGPRGKRVLTEVDRAVVTHAAENGVGKAVAAGIGTELAGRVDAVFRPNDAGDLNVTPRTPGQSLKVADVLESLQRDPTSYTLTAEQRVAWERVLQPLLKLRARLVERYGLATTQDADGDLLAYFPRIVIETPNTPDNEQRPGGASVGGRQGFQKSRAFRTERQGWEAGYRYEPSIERRLVTAIERLYKAMADQRLANNPALAGRTRTEVRAELMEWHAEELGAGLMTVADVESKADRIMGRGAVNLPAFAGRTFAVPNATGQGLDLSLKQQLERAFPNSESRLRDLLVRGNNAVKAVRLGFDLGAPLVQGLPLFFRDPVTWGRATGASLQALFSPVGLARMLQTPENRQAVRELAQVGSPIGSLPEMLAGLGRGELLDRIPVFRGVRAAFGRQFSTFMDVAKLELWKAHRGLYPQSQWSELAQSLEALLLSGRMDSVGVGRTQALTERVLLLAPSYYRGAVNLVSQAARPGVSGQIARRALLHFGAGMLTTFVGVGLALGMGEDELKRRLDPTHPQFLQWTVRPNEKRSVNLGFGGIFRSWVKLLGNMVRTSLDTPGDWLALDSQRNPLARWLRGHLAPIPALAMDLTGRDFMGRQNDLTDVPAQLLPLWAAQMVDKTGQLPPTWRELTASWTGLSGYSQTPFQYIRSRAARWDADRLRAQGQPPPGKRMPEESPYARLEWALRLENYPAARKEYETLITRLPPAPGKTPQRMILEHFRNAAQDGGFVQYRAQENDFRKSLSREERDLYDLARKEQRDLFVRLRRTLAAP